MNIYMVVEKKHRTILAVWPTLFEARWYMEQSGLLKSEYIILEIEAHEVICP